MALSIVAAGVYSVNRPSEPVDQASAAAYERDRDAKAAETKAEGDAKEASAAKTKAAEASKEARYDGDLTTTGKLAGQNVRLDLPTSGPAKATAIYFHGQGGNVNDHMNESWLNRLRDDGWAVASSDFHMAAWGSSKVVEDARALTKWAEKESGADVTLLIGASMGGLGSLNSMISGDMVPKCWYGTMPVVDIEAARETVPGAAGQMGAHMNAGSRSEANASKHLKSLPMETRYRVLASPQDTAVLKKQHAAPLAKYLDANGYKVSALTVEGEHGHTSHFNGLDLLEFSKKCS